MGGALPHKRVEDAEQIVQHYEKRIFDLEQLIQISKSLNAILDYNELMRAILSVSMGQMKSLGAGAFVKTELDGDEMLLHRSIEGFQVSGDTRYALSSRHPVVDVLAKAPFCFTLPEIRAAMAGASFEPLESLAPWAVTFLRGPHGINGLLFLGEPVTGEDLTVGDREFLSTVGNIAGLAVHNALLYEAATTDRLTKLKQRHIFREMLDREIRVCRSTAKPVSVVMLDLDRFKLVNDEKGHFCGDMVLERTAQILRRSLRKTDLAARYGGEEFVLLLPGIAVATAAQIAERIRRNVEEFRMSFHNEDVGVTISAGVAQFDPEQDTVPDDTVSRCDAALYRAKAAGRNTVRQAG